VLEVVVLPPGAAILTTSSAMIPTNYPSVLLMGEAEPILETVSWNWKMNLCNVWLESRFRVYISCGCAGDGLTMFQKICFLRKFLLVRLCYEWTD
jgi:hypothetical protein